MKALKFVLIATLVIGSFIITSCGNSASSTKETTEKETVKQTYDTFPAVGVSSYYHANEVKADNAFKGQKFNVKGVVQSITKDFADNCIVTLASDNEFMAVHCTFNSCAEAANLNKGETIIIQGTCKGMIIGSVGMEDCTLLK